MKQRAYEWNPRPPTAGERVACGIWLAAFLPVVADYYAGWRWFSGFDNWVLGCLFLAGLFLFARLPSVTRIQGVKRPLSYWLVIGLVLAAAAGSFVLKPTG
jgi:hypothetical protein